jgi:hypothetical protein
MKKTPLAALAVISTNKLIIQGYLSESHKIAGIIHLSGRNKGELYDEKPESVKYTF